MGALSTVSRSFQFFKPSEVGQLWGGWKNKGGKFPPNSKFCWKWKGIHLPFPIISGLLRPTKKTRRTYVKLSTTSRSQRLREFHCFKKSFFQLWPENPTFPPRRIPSPGTRRMCPWRVTLFLTALVVVVHGAKSPLKLDRCWCWSAQMQFSFNRTRDVFP